MTEAIHNYSVQVAVECGIPAAVILYNICFWCNHNRANGTHFMEGKNWTYNSNKAFASQFPEMTQRQIRTAIQRLVEDGYILAKNFPGADQPRTMWYTLTDKGDQIMQNCHFDPEKAPVKMTNSQSKVTEMSFRNDAEVISITDTNTDTLPDSIYVTSVTAKRQFTPPTQDDVETYMREYARKKGYYIDAADAAEDYCQFYGSKGWKVGSVSMKDWRMAACRWVKSAVSRRKETPAYTGSPNYDPSKPLY